MMDDLTPAFEKAIADFRAAQQALYKTIGLSVNDSLSADDHIYHSYNSADPTTTDPAVVDLRGKEWTLIDNGYFRGQRVYVYTDTTKGFSAEAITAFDIGSDESWVHFNMRGLFFAIASQSHTTIQEVRLAHDKPLCDVVKVVLIMSREDQVYLSRSEEERLYNERTETEKRWDTIHDHYETVKEVEISSFQQFAAQYPKEGAGLVPIQDFIKRLNELIRGNEKYVTLNELVSDSTRVQLVFNGKTQLQHALPRREVWSYSFVRFYPVRQEEVV